MLLNRFQSCQYLLLQIRAFKKMFYKITLHYIIKLLDTYEYDTYKRKLK
jgi:hypothetical protein